MKRKINLVEILTSILKVKRLLLEQKIDVLVCHTLIGAGVGRIAALLAKTKCVVYFAHGLACAPAQGFFKWHFRYWEEKILGHATDAIVVMNNYDEKLCRTRKIIKDTEKIFRIHGVGVDITRYNPDDSQQAHEKLSEELSIGGDLKIILFVARLVPEKGPLVLLEAAKRILAERTDVCFLIAGEGPLMSKLLKIVDKEGLEKNFRLLGWREDVCNMMKAADIFALPTYYNEGLPVSILEAMACGKPVVATVHRGCEDIVVDGQTGFLVPVKQADPLADKLSLLLDDDKLRRQMGQAGRRRVEQNFELKHCIKNIVNSLENTIS